MLSMDVQVDLGLIMGVLMREHVSVELSIRMLIDENRSVAKLEITMGNSLDVSWTRFQLEDSLIWDDVKCNC
ncbi:hypothetical protein VNO77_02605 [Canavalia gladiata]|uniref:Uncharacterized protein n=1 Tax=Canavalia gladiata TaxID=3824 RepID=A0AAN9MYA4_CANGL